MDVKDARREWFATAERPALQDFWAVFAQHFEALRTEGLEWLALSLRGRPTLPEAPAQLERLLHSWGPQDRSPSRAQHRSEWEQIEAVIAQCGDFFTAQGVSLDDWQTLYGGAQAALTRLLIAAHGSEPSRLAAALGVLQEYAQLTTSTLTRSLLRAKDRLLHAERQKTDQARARFTRLSESGLLGVIICDYQGNIVEANDGFLEKFGYSRNDLLSGEVRWLNMTPPEWLELDTLAIEQLRAHGKTRPWEKEYFHRDGHRIPILVGVATLSDTETIAFVLDISERKRLEEVRARSLELETQNRRIQEASRLKSEFLANMSHELRTPLNSIIGFTELLRDREVDPGSPQYMEFLEDILNSGRHLQQLINDVLDLAKVEAGKIELRPEPVDVEHLVSEVCGVLRTIASDKQLRVATEVAPEVRRATLDPSRFKQILYNYLSNAIKFTPHGGAIGVRVRPESGGMLRITVEDTGIGISPTDLGRLFVEFQQLEAGATKRHAGTGLGLALTKRLVEAQGGSVEVKSVPGKGSQFSALLPLHATEFLATFEEVAREHRGRAGATSILVVEDDARDRALLVNTLAHAGYGVETATTGTQAVASCKERAFDAITLDLLLPDMTGLDVLHRVRLEGKNVQTPVIVVSVVAERGIMAGFSVQDYLTKPVNGHELLEALEHASVPPSKGGKVLIVDDDPAAHRLMSATLENLGYEIRSCSNGAEALAFAAEERPIAIVSDLLMPSVDGFEFLLRFRAEERNRSVPVIVWTMKDLTAEDQRQLRSLAARVVAKSDWTPASFLQDLRSLISHSVALSESNALVGGALVGGAPVGGALVGSAPPGGALSASALSESGARSSGVSS